jgi:hypothetical protein
MNTVPLSSRSPLHQAQKAPRDRLNQSPQGRLAQHQARRAISTVSEARAAAIESVADIGNILVEMAEALEISGPKPLIPPTYRRRGNAGPPPKYSYCHRTAVPHR